MGTEQLPSTSYYSQTDGGPERMNQEIRTYLRTFIYYSQSDEGRLLAVAQLAFNSRVSATT